MRNKTFLRSILVLLIAPFMAYEGINLGSKYGSVDESKGQPMTITATRNLNGRTIFPDYQATGELPSGESVTVSLRKREFEQLRPGDTIDVLPLRSSKEPYVTVSRIEKMKPFMSVGPLTFTWHFPASVGFVLLVVAYFAGVGRSDNDI